MSFTSRLRFVPVICLAALLSATAIPARAVVDPPIVTISDKYPDLQILPPGFYGPPQNDFATVKYEDDNGISSWGMKIQEWQPDYTPSGYTDTGGDMQLSLLDSGTGDNPQKTKQFRPKDLSFYRAQGAVHFCFYTYGYGATGSYMGKKFESYTPIQLFVQ